MRTSQLRGRKTTLLDIRCPKPEWLNGGQIPKRQARSHREIPLTCKHELINQLLNPGDGQEHQRNPKAPAQAPRQRPHDDQFMPRQVTGKVDAVVIGSGIGGLCCAALCAKEGAGARGPYGPEAPPMVERDGYRFESGPSLGGPGSWPSTNPWRRSWRHSISRCRGLHSDWDVLLPEGQLRVGVGPREFEQVVQDLRGPQAVDEWRRFGAVLEPIAAAAAALPLLSLRPGVEVLSDVESGSHAVAASSGDAASGRRLRPLVDQHLQDPSRHWVDLLCFLISGMPMGDTNAAAMATLFGGGSGPMRNSITPLVAVRRWMPWCRGSPSRW